MPNVSIEISARDEFSPAVKSMRNANQGFNKDLQETQKTLSDFLKKQDALSSMKKKMQTDLDDASNALKRAKKAFAESNDEINRTNLEKAHENYNKVSDDLKSLNSEAKNTQKSIRNLSEEQSRESNKAGGGVLSRLAKAGLTKMMGDSFSGAAQAVISSAFSNETGNAVSSVLGGITNGAALGTAVAPGVGTAIGAAAGAASGAINAATKTFTDKDNYFKSTVQSQYNTAKNTEQSNLESGSDIASQRELDQISFTKLLGGQAQSEKFLASIRTFGNKTPFEYDQLTQLSKTLLNYGYKQDEIIPMLTKVGDTGAVTGMSMEDINMVATVLGRMKSTGKTTMEYLNMLMDRHIPVLDYLSRATGKSKAQVLKMVSKGLIPGATAAREIADAMGKVNKGGMKLQSETYSGLKSTLEDVKDDLKAALGEGYNEEAKKGIQDQIQTMSGKTGESLKAVYKMKGKFQADLQNQQYQLEADAYTSVTTGKITGKWKNKDHVKELQQLAKDFKDAKAKAAKGDQEAQNRAEIDTIKASIIAGNEYKTTEGYQLEQQGNLDLIDSIQTDDALNTAYTQTGRIFGEKMSEGFVKAYWKGINAGLNPEGLKSTGNGISTAAAAISNPSIGISLATGILTNKSSKSSTKKSASHEKNIGMGGMAGFTGQATGLFRVPYNNYPAMLHEGETVSTAVESRSKKAGGVKVEINGPVTIRKESDIDEIAERLYRKLLKAEAITP